MKQVKRNIKNGKRIGRPSTGIGQPTLVRLHRPLIAEIDYWKRNSDISRPEAIRQLVEWALAQSRKQEPVDDANIQLPARG